MTNGESWLTRAENRASSLAHTADHLLEVGAESALHAAVQDPIDALTQIANHVAKPLIGHTLPTLHLVDAPPPAKAGTAEWYAEAIGTGVGRAADCIVLALGLEAAGVTTAAGAALGGIFESEGAAAAATAFGKAAVSGALYGLTFVPAKDEKHFWKEHLINGVGWSIGSGAASLAASGVVAMVDQVGEQFAADGLSDTIAGRAIKAVVGGTTSGLTKNETYMLFGQTDATPGAMGAKMVQSLTKGLVSEASVQ